MCGQGADGSVWSAAMCLGIGWALAVGVLVGVPAASHWLRVAPGTFLIDALATVALAFGGWLSAVRLHSRSRRAAGHALTWALAAALAFAWFSRAPLGENDRISIDWTARTPIASTYGPGRVQEGGRMEFGSWRGLESMALLGAIVGLSTGWLPERDRLSRRLVRALAGAAIWSLCVIVGGHATVIVTYGSGMAAGMTFGAPFAARHFMSVAIAIVILGGAVGAWFTGAAMSWTAWRLQGRTR